MKNNNKALLEYLAAWELSLVAHDLFMEAI
jgi:hypothetical protein